MSPDLERAVSAALSTFHGSGTVAFEARSRGGGLHSTWILTDSQDRRWFLKSAVSAPDDQFPSEAHGLGLLAESGAVRIPLDPIAGTSPPFLLMEAIPIGSRGPGFEETFGRALATLHRASPQPSDRYGLDRDNYLGATPQPNDWLDDWVEFVRTRRIGPQIDRIRKAGLAEPGLDTLVERLLDQLDEVLAGPSEPSCLLHGDLWSGNVLADERGAPVLVDPACWYGRREAELGMMLLFGSFSERCYDAYQEVWPLAEGWRRRAQVFVVYHLLNHVNLFGSGYLGSCVSALRRLV